MALRDSTILTLLCAAVVGVCGGRTECGNGKYCKYGACCFDVLNGGGTIYCASTPFDTCSMDGKRYCTPDAPIMCGTTCCGPEYACRNNGCVLRSSRSDGSTGETFGVVTPAKVGVEAEGHAKEEGAVTNSTGDAPLLRWEPPRWQSGTILYKASETMHLKLLPMISHMWRAYGAGNCYVLGFPKTASSCDNKESYECKETAATVVQDGPYHFYNNNPVMRATNYHKLDWCNDDPAMTLTYQHNYEATETVSYSTTLSTSVKATVGVESKSKAEVNVGVGGGSQEFTMSASLETDFSSSSTQKKEETKKWTSSNSVLVGPRSHVYHQCYLLQGTFSSPFEGRVRITSPVSWACQKPEVNPKTYLSTRKWWVLDEFKNYMKSAFQFSDADIDEAFTQKISGTFTGVAGQAVRCSTHTVRLKKGESCAWRAQNAEMV